MDEPAEYENLAAPPPMRDQILRYGRGDIQQIGVDDVITLDIEVAAITYIDQVATALLVVRATPAPQIDEAEVLATVKGISHSMAVIAEAALATAREAALTKEANDG